MWSWIRLFLILGLYKTFSFGQSENSTDGDVAKGALDEDLDSVFDREGIPGCFEGTDLGQESLCISTSDVVDRQVVIANVSAKMVIVFNPEKEQYAFLSSDGKGAFYDKILNLGFIETRGVWKENVFNYALQLDIDDALDNLEPIEITSMKPNDSFYLTVSNILYHFGEGLKTEIQKVGPGGKSFCGFELIVKFFRDMKPVIKSVLTFGGKIGWFVFKGGFDSLLLLYKWVGEFVNKLTGGALSLITKGITFAFKPMAQALCGVKSFYIMLKSMVEKINYCNVMEAIITAPAQMAKFVYGLGGEIMKGISGIYRILAHILELIETIVKSTLKAITGAVLDSFKKLVATIKNFFSCRKCIKSEDIKQLHKDSDDILGLIQQQDERFENRAQLETFENFWKASKGEGKLKVGGIKVGAIISTLIKKVTQPGVDLVSAILKLLQPVLPFKLSIPEFLTNILQTSNDRSAFETLKNFSPDVDLFNATISSTRTIIPDEKSLTTIELLERNPFAYHIYLRLVETLKQHDDNVSVEYLLNAENVATARLRLTLIRLVDNDS